MKERLLCLADQMRKVADLSKKNEALEKQASEVRLDPNKVIDFLVVFSNAGVQ